MWAWEVEARWIRYVLQHVARIPCLGYVDDFFGFVPKRLAALTRQVVCGVFNLLGLPLKKDKVTGEDIFQEGERLEILGVQFDLTDSVPSATVSAERKIRIGTDVGEFLGGAVPITFTAGGLKKFFGRVNFILTTHGVRTSAILPVIWAMHGKIRRDSLCLRRALCQIRELVLSLQPVQLQTSVLLEDSVQIFTDASYEPEAGTGTGFVGGIMFCGSRRLAFSEEIQIPARVASPIAYLEMLAVLMAFRTFGEAVRGRRCHCFVDNANTLYACIRGRSRIAWMCALAHTLGRMVQELNVVTWFDYVDSERNPADAWSERNPADQISWRARGGRGGHG